MIAKRFLFVCTLIPFFWMACDENSKPSPIIFESAARAVLQPMGISSSADPMIQVSPSGKLAMLSTYKEGEQVRLGLFLSDNGGDTFSAPVQVSENGAHVHSHGENSPTLIYTPVEIYALWEQASDQGGTDLVAARSLNFGHSFDSPVRVTDKTDASFNGFSNFGRSLNGDLYVVWLDGREKDSKQGTFSVYLSKSSDRGKTFGKNILIGKDACPCCRPSLSFDQKGVHVAWRKVFEGDIRDIVVSSSDDGEHFASSVRVAEDQWKIAGCPDSGPVLSSTEGQLYVAWLTEADQKPVIKVSLSTDGGKSFQKADTITKNILDVNHPRFTISPEGKIFLIFEGRNSEKNAGWSPAQAYICPVGKNGSIGEPQPVSSADRPVSYPALAVGSAGRLFVTWTQPTANDRQSVLIRGRIKTS